MSVVFSKQADLKPPRRRYWLKAEPDEDAAKTRADLTTLYAHALLEAGERVLSADARPGSQARERTPPPLPMGPGRAERRAVA